jgi:hypothetical protein
VLTAEDLQIHDRVLCGVFHDVRPRDFFELMYIKDLAHRSPKLKACAAARSTLFVERMANDLSEWHASLFSRQSVVRRGFASNMASTTF